MDRKLGGLILLVLAGCASTGVTPTGTDTFMVSKRSAQVGFGDPVGAKADVYRQANEFCGKRGQAIEEVDYQEQPSGFGRPASASLEFRCVPR